MASHSLDSSGRMVGLMQYCGSGGSKAVVCVDLGQLALLAELLHGILKTACSDGLGSPCLLLVQAKVRSRSIYSYVHFFLNTDFRHSFVV